MSSYEKKLASFIEMCNSAKEKVQIALSSRPQVLGENYEEVIESLNTLASAWLVLIIVPPDKRKEP